MIHILTTIKSISLIGLTGYQINVEVDVSNNMPKWEIIGLPDNSIRESKERVKAAIKNSGYELRSKKILINLAPAEIKKEGSAFDLAIAVGILNNIGYIKNEKIEEYTILGELSLEGKISGISGILPMCIELQRLGIKNVILPQENVQEAQLLNNLNVYGVNNLKEVVNFLNGELKIENHKIIENNIEEHSKIDFNEVKGQKNVKRALEIAAAGGHNCIMIGSPRIRKNNVSTKNIHNTPRYEF